jgi:hypothetical protein
MGEIALIFFKQNCIILVQVNMIKNKCIVFEDLLVSV